jgi:haloacid dehalogenase-like hydrolase
VLIAIGFLAGSVVLSRYAHRHGVAPEVVWEIATRVLIGGLIGTRLGGCLLPERKTSAVEGLRRAHGPVAMVGDGINDAPALATADVGVAMGAGGTDVALEAADLVLMVGDLTKLPHAIRLARQALSTIRQNIALSLGTVAVLVAAALAGRLSLASGLLLNEGTALLIIANGLRLLRPAGRGRVGPGQRQANGHTTQEVADMRCGCRGGRGAAAAAVTIGAAASHSGAETIVQDLVELERRLERDLQAVREQLGRGQETA